jgi:hypothetical protein
MRADARLAGPVRGSETRDVILAHVRKFRVTDGYADADC